MRVSTSPAARSATILSLSFGSIGNEMHALPQFYNYNRLLYSLGVVLV